MNERDELGLKIISHLNKLRESQGWTIDDLANYLEINSLTLRNSLSKNIWSDLIVTVLKWAKAIPEELFYAYKKAIERSKIEKRREANSIQRKMEAV